MATKLYPTIGDPGIDPLGSSEDVFLAALAQTNFSDAITVTTFTGPTTGLQFQYFTNVGFYTNQLAAVTISGTVTFNLWGRESGMNANSTLRVKVERCDSSGAVLSTVVDSAFGTELGTSYSANNWTATPTSTTLTNGDRLRFIFYVKDATGVTMGNGFTCNVQYNNTVANSADTWVQFNETITEYTPPGGTPLKNTLMLLGVGKA